MSIPATEHSVMTAWRTEREAMENMIDHFGSGILACVMDSYDYVQVSRIHAAYAAVGSCSPLETVPATDTEESQRLRHMYSNTYMLYLAQKLSFS